MSDKMNALDITVDGELYKGFADQIDWANSDRKEMQDDYEMEVKGRHPSFDETVHALFLSAIVALQASPEIERSFLGWLAIRGQRQAGSDLALCGSVPGLPMGDGLPGARTIQAALKGLRCPEISIDADGLVFACTDGIC